MADRIVITKDITTVQTLPISGNVFGVVDGELAQGVVEPNGIVEQGNTNAVSGGEVFDWADVKLTDSPQLFNPKMIKKNKLVNINGGISEAIGWEYTSIPLDPSQDFITVSGQSISSSTQYRFTDINGELISNVSYATVPNIIGIPIPLNAVNFEITIKRNVDGYGYLNTLLINYGDKIDEYKKPLVYSIFGHEIKAKETDKKDLKIYKSGNLISIRSKFNAEKDLVRQISLNGSKNGASNLLNTKLILKDENINNDGVIIHEQGDSVPAPFQVNVVDIGYLNIGGNHGVMCVTDCISASHGKTSDDLLSIWKDANNFEFYLVSILNQNSLRFISKPYNQNGFDKISTSPISPLTHISGGVNTSSIPVSGSAYEYKPCINAISVKAYIDGVELINDGYYNCNELKVIDTHNIVDPTSPTLVLPYIVKNNGTMAKNSLVHRFFGNGSYTVENTTDWNKNHKLTNIGIIQPQVIQKGAYSSIMTYAMNVGIVSGLDFKNGFDLSQSISTTYVAKHHFTEPLKSVQQFSEVLYNGSNPEIGCGFGYNPLIGLGKQDSLLQNQYHFALFPFKKLYPYSFNNRISENGVYTGIGYYAYWDATINPELSADYYIPHGDNSYIYFLNIKSNIVKKTIKLDKKLISKSFEIVNYSSNIKIHIDNYIPESGLIISGNIGDWCVLKINK